MTKGATDSSFRKSSGQVILEHVIVVLCLCVIALRTTFSEGPGARLANQPINLGDRVYSLCVSAVLILSFVTWLVSSLCGKRFIYRLTGLEIGLAVFCAAALIAGLAAADKRAAVTDFVTLCAPVLMAVVLAQSLDSQSKIKLVLTVIAALGVASAYQCAYQFFVSNQIEIEQYEQAPESKLEPLGIQPNTLAHWQFEHRLYSRGVNGYFTTSNSAGSFSMLAYFAGFALLAERFKTRKPGASAGRKVLVAGITLAVLILGLAITRSKGAIAGALIAAALLGLCFLFADRLGAHRKRAAVLGAAALVVVGCGAVLYGRAYGRLPGGNSMLVRWQYWQASADMYVDHALTGVGPGNFVYFYPRYKTGAALETVSDPHNFLLAVLTQYGPLGLVGLLVMIVMPLWAAASARGSSLEVKTKGAGLAYRRLAGVSAIAISATLLLVRPIIMDAGVHGALDVLVYAVFTLYIAPIVAFAVGFWLLMANVSDGETAHPNIITVVLLCALSGFLIHNLIDFAIFEPGILTTFWAVVACLIGLDLQQRSRPQIVLKPTAPVRIAVVAAGAAVIWVFFSYSLIPMAKSTAKIRQAHQATSLGDLERAHGLLAAAAHDDRLSAAALSLNGRLYLEQFYAFGLEQKDLLLRSEKCLREAIARNGADFKNFERLAEVYSLLAEKSPSRQKSDYLEQAFNSALGAVERYPGSGRLRFRLAQIAEELGRTDVAVRQYRHAVEIEDSYRRQFRLMYPGQEVFSRLGQEKYQQAIERAEQLARQSSPSP
jgi:O-antigen ligase